MTMNRDTNASKNILEVLEYHLEHKVRHPDFDRSRTLTIPKVSKALRNKQNQRLLKSERKLTRKLVPNDSSIITTTINTI